jgi:hypothetical protein
MGCLSLTHQTKQNHSIWDVLTYLILKLLVSTKHREYLFRSLFHLLDISFGRVLMLAICLTVMKMYCILLFQQSDGFNILTSPVKVYFEVK